MGLLEFWTVLLLSALLNSTSNASDCPDSWVEFSGSCYYFGKSSLRFSSAESYCRQHSGHLVHINNSHENGFLKEWLRQFKNTNWWIGLTDEYIEGEWRWYDTHTSPEYTDWDPGQPDNTWNADCATISPWSDFAGWDDVPCTYDMYPICEKRVSTSQTGGQSIIG